MKRILAILVLTALIAFAGQAFADMTGSTVTSQYYAYGAAYNGYGSPTTFVANGTVQQTFCSGCGAQFDLSVTGSQVIYNFSGGDIWSDSVTSLNSGGLFIRNGNLLTFSGFTVNNVSIDASSTFAGFDSSRLTYNSNNIAIDVMGLTSSGSLVLDVNQTAAPEPASLALLVTGLLGIAGTTRLRFRK